MNYIHKLEECDCCKQVEVLEQIHKKELERQLILYGAIISTLKVTTGQQRIRIDRLSCGG
jgi:hypothetical protein